MSEKKGRRASSPPIGSPGATNADNLMQAVSRHWGFDTFLPLQQQAMEAVLGRRDSLVVLPTGGGKSLCYQAPALLGNGVTIVVSPLISLMKDQVDGLVACGVPAAQLNSSLEAFQQKVIERELIEGRLKLLFVSPERLASTSFRNLLSTVRIDAFAIDEAHCISHWGHDFRPEYRQLRDLRRDFPNVSLHAYTATATAKVRADVREQLELRDPLELIGSFDRPNLTYRVLRRTDELRQIEEILGRHEGEAGIVYCIRRRNVDEIAALLRERGHDAVAYHAGLTQEERKRAQDLFLNEGCRIIVATVAFGMGIDRSDVRFVIHAGMPKSVEHYQQESGRAGRDGLPAECVVLYAPNDALAWQSILETDTEDEATRAQQAIAMKHVREMQRYCAGSLCRHRTLTAYFGQLLASEKCGACDVCLGELTALDESQLIAQKIISCVVRLRERFGVAYVGSVLRGEDIQKVRSRGHESLSTYGILRDASKEEVRDWIEQLVAGGILRLEGDEYPILRVTSRAKDVLGGRERVTLLGRAEEVQAEEESWVGVDRPLFERLRAWRKREAATRSVAPYVIFHDTTLRQIAAVRPSNYERLRRLSGVSDAKLDLFGRDLLTVVRNHCKETRLPFDCDLLFGPRRGGQASSSSRRRDDGAARSAASAIRDLAHAMFARNASVDEVVERTARKRPTVVEYLTDFIATARPPSITAWIPPDRYSTIAEAAKKERTSFLKPIRMRLGDDYSYDEIRLVLAHLKISGTKGE